MRILIGYPSLIAIQWIDRHLIPLLSRSVRTGKRPLLLESYRLSKWETECLKIEIIKRNMQVLIVRVKTLLMEVKHKNKTNLVHLAFP